MASDGRLPLASATVSDVLASTLAIHKFDDGLGELEERKALRTTHRRVWCGAQLLLQFFQQNSAERERIAQAGIQVLELGSGSGWLGLNLAAMLPNARLTLSELHHAVPALHAQLDRVSAVDPSLRERVQVELDWEDMQSSLTQLTRWDYIIGSELLYSHAGLRALPRVFKALAAPTTRMVYMHVPERKASVDSALHAEFAAAGLQLRPLEWKLEQTEARPHSSDERSSDKLDCEWLPDGGLFADEDDEYRASRPTPIVFEVLSRSVLG